MHQSGQVLMPLDCQGHQELGQVSVRGVSN